MAVGSRKVDSGRAMGWTGGGPTARVFLLLTLAVAAVPTIGPEPVMAAPASPHFRMVVRDDGTSFPARRWGDENLNGWETGDGYSIVHDEANGWTYAEHGLDGSLVTSGRRVGHDAPPAHVKKRLRPTAEHRAKGIKRRTSREVRLLAAAGPLRSSPSFGDGPSLGLAGPQMAPPTSGTFKVPVVLATFSDRQPTVSVGAVEESIFGGAGTYSVREYFKEVSYGRLQVEPGAAGVVGWVVLPRGHDYYGANTGGMDGDDLWPGDLVYEAAQLADPTVNFSEYDLDGDCRVDAFAVIHQGTGEADGNGGLPADIWPHRWNLFSAQAQGKSHYGAYETNDTCLANPSHRVFIDDYTIQSEVLGDGGINTIGLFAHEFGHSLGLPDLYDTDYSSEGAGDWSLMAGGSWTSLYRAGDRPAHPDPWCKYKLGWITPTPITLSQPVVTYTFAPAENSAACYQILAGSPVSGTGEYFLLENRQKAKFDAGLPGQGLFVWHVNESMPDNTKEWYPGCQNCTGTYKVALVQADGLFSLETKDNRGDAGDPFPGSGNVTLLTPVTTPTSNLYGGPSGFSLSAIRVSGSDILAEVVLGNVLSVAVAGTGGGTVSSSPAGVSCSLGTCLAQYAPGTTITLTAVPDGTSAFTGWSGACTGVGACVVTLDQARVTTATFARNYSLSVGVSGTGSGTVTSSPAGISCAGGSCAAQFVSGTPVTLYATPGNGSLFSGWSGACVGGDGCTITMSGDRSVGASFDANLMAKLLTQEPSYYGTLGGAYAVPVVGSSATIVARDIDYPENLTLDRGVNLILRGGYDSGFAAVSGYSRLIGTLTVTSGALTVDCLKIQ